MFSAFFFCVELAPVPVEKASVINVYGSLSFEIPNNEIREIMVSYFLQRDLIIVFSSLDKLLRLEYTWFSKSNSTFDFFFNSDLFCSFFLIFQWFPPLNFL